MVFKLDKVSSDLVVTVATSCNIFLLLANSFVIYYSAVLILEVSHNVTSSDQTQIRTKCKERFFDINEKILQI